jgi:hypothetical protein
VYRLQEDSLLQMTVLTKWSRGGIMGLATGIVEAVRQRSSDGKSKTPTLYRY